MRLADRNPMIPTLALTLIFDAIVAVLAVPGMLMVNNVDTTTGLVAGGAVALLALVAGGTIRRGTVGWVLGWATQVALVALGLLTPWMFAVGGIFAVLYIVEFILGRRIEAVRSS